MNIRPLKIWEIPRLLKFKERNDYRVLSEAQHKSDGFFYAVLKVLWYGNRMLTMIAEKDGNKIVGYIAMVFGFRRALEIQRQCLSGKRVR